MRHYTRSLLFAIAIGYCVACLKLNAQQNFWMPMDSSPNGVYELASHPAVGSLAVNIYPGNLGVFRSSDNGSTWTKISGSIPVDPDSYNLFSVFIDPHGHIFVNAIDGLYRSTDIGQHWTRLESAPLPDQFLRLGFLNDGTIFSISNTGIYRSTDDGASWIYSMRIPGAKKNAHQFLSITTLGKRRAFVATDVGILMSMNGGKIWRFVRRIDEALRTITSNARGTIIAAGFHTDSPDVYFYRSLNAGRTWTRVAPNPPFLMRNVMIFLDPSGTQYSRAFESDSRPLGIIRSIDNGATWSPADNTGLLDRDVEALDMTNDGYLLAGTYAGGLHKSTKAVSVGSLTGYDQTIDDERSPTRFAFYQNYPNPFNPTTIIEFELANDALVTAKVFNSLGQEIATLADQEEFSEGGNDIEFDASNHPSGVYFCRIVAQDIESGHLQFTSVRKMVLLR